MSVRPFRFPPDPDRVSRSWFEGPPAGEPGCLVPIRRRVAVGDGVEIAVLNVVAFSSGFAFEIDVQGDRAKCCDVHGLEYFEGGPVDSVFRFGLELEDGRRATNLDQVIGKRRRGFGLVVYSTSSRPRSRTVNVWSWPLPAGHQATFACDWIALGVAFTRVELDATAVRAAGMRSGRLGLIGHHLTVTFNRGSCGASAADRQGWIEPDARVTKPYASIEYLMAASIISMLQCTGLVIVLQH